MNSVVGKQFNLILPSNSSMSYHPENTTTRFTTVLGKRFELRGEWEVALLEVVYPNTFFNIIDGQNKFQVIEKPSGKTTTIEIPPGYYDDPHTIIDHINASRFNTFGDVALGSKQHTVIRYRTPNKIPSVRLSDRFALQLGFDPGTDLSLVTRSPRTADLSLGNPQIAYIYCDLLESLPVGDSFAPLLRIVNMKASGGKHAYGSTSSVVYNNPIYVPLLKKNFSSVLIDIRDSTGHNLPFSTGFSVLTLSFRPVSSPT